MLLPPAFTLPHQKRTDDMLYEYLGDPGNTRGAKVPGVAWQPGKTCTDTGSHDQAGALLDL